MTPKAGRGAKRPSLSALEFGVLGLFFASGASALVYEVVWSRLLTYTFGGSAFAIATVLAAYMGGLALGSLWFGKQIDRKGHPLVVYGILEAAIGLWALILPFILSALDGLYGSLYQSTNLGGYPLNLIRFLFCFLLLLVPTTMMGGTLPILGKLLLGNWQGLGSRAGLLYGVNTLGAVVGVFGGGFILIPALGLNGSTYLAILVNMGVALVAMLLAKRYAFPRGAELEETPSQRLLYIPKDPVKRAVLLVYAGSGFAALAYEVAWTKVLSMILGTTTYAFSSMLTTFLLGLALGALIFGRIADRWGKPERLLVCVQTAIPLLALLTIPILEALPQLWVDSFADLRDSWIKLEAFRFLLAAGTMFIPALLMGGTFPLVTRVYVDRQSLGSSLGTLYAANTLGAILGSFLTGFILIPLIGRQSSILAATLINLVVAGVLILSLKPKTLPGTFKLVVALLVIALVPAAVRAVKPWDKRILASGAYYYPERLAEFQKIEDSYENYDLVFYRESTEAAISVWRHLYITSLRMNGKIDASSHGDMRTQRLISHLPMIYHRNSGQETMVIGLASGITVGSLLTYPVERVDVVELVEGVDEAAVYFSHYNYDCLDDPRYNLIVNDGRNQLKLSDKTYDIIISQPTNPWIAGVGALFTREFFDLTRSRLNPGGVACVWVQMYHMQETEVKAVLGTFADAFEHVDLWMGTRGDLILMGSEEPLHWDWEYYQSVFQGAPGEDLKSIEILSPETLFSFFVSRKQGLLDYVGREEQRVTDDNLILEYRVPRQMFQGDDADADELIPYMSHPGDILEGADAAAREGAHLYQQAHAQVLTAFFGSAPYEDRNRVYRAVLDRAPHEILAKEILSGQMNERGVEELQQGRMEEARATFTGALEIATRSEAALSLSNLGYIAFREGLTDSAANAWRASLEYEPLFPSSLFNLGLLEGRRGNHALAAEYYQLASEVDPRDASLLNNTAYHLAMADGDLNRALGLAERAVKEDRSPSHLDTLGLILLKRNAPEDALAVLQEAVTLDPEYHEARLRLGQAQKRLGQATEARQSLERVITHSDDDDLIEEARNLLNTF